MVEPLELEVVEVAQLQAPQVVVLVVEMELFLQDLLFFQFPILKLSPVVPIPLAKVEEEPFP